MTRALPLLPLILAGCAGLEPPDPGDAHHHPDQGDDSLHPAFMDVAQPVVPLRDDVAPATPSNLSLAARIEAIEGLGGVPRLHFAPLFGGRGDRESRPASPGLRLAAGEAEDEDEDGEGDEGPGLQLAAAADEASDGDAEDPPADGEEGDEGPGASVTDTLAMPEPTGPLADLDLPHDMPPVRFPRFRCQGEQLDESKRVWAMAHHHVWRTWQLIEFIGESGDRAALWVDGWDPAREHRNWSPRTWFGPYAGYRFDAVRRTVRKLWERFRTARINGTRISVDCIDRSQRASACFRDNPGTGRGPSAYHFPIGNVNLCPRFWDRDLHPMARGMVHEVLHHTWVSWKRTTWRGAVVGDLHTHAHGRLCGRLTTEKMYGAEKSMHLAETPRCWHRDIALRNTDNYAWLVYRVGRAVYRGDLDRFPTLLPESASPDDAVCEAELPDDPDFAGVAPAACGG